jgi:hypothetical protein
MTSEYLRRLRNATRTTATDKYNQELKTKTKPKKRKPPADDDVIGDLSNPNTNGEQP